MVRRVLLGLVLVGLCGCASVPGSVTYKYVNNRWEPDTATFAKENITASEIKATQDRLNAK
jgi:hypothetical protein